MTGVQVVVVAGIVILVAMVALFTGIWYGEGRNAELIAELEAELDARQMVMPPEVAHEPAWGRPAAPVVVQALADTRWDLAPVRDRLAGIDDLDVWMVTAFADMDQFMGKLLAAAQIPDELVMRMSSPQTAELERGR
jgi:hypothetical protein